MILITAVITMATAVVITYLISESKFRTDYIKIQNEYIEAQETLIKEQKEYAKLQKEYIEILKGVKLCHTEKNSDMN